MGAKNCLVGFFGVLVWFYFLFVFLEISAFIVNLGHDFPSLGKIFCYNIDYNPTVSSNWMWQTLLNVALLGFFALPHSIFARPVIKERLGKTKKGEGVSAYRSIFVLYTNIALHLLMKYW